MKNLSIQTFRAQGLKVSVRHYRFTYQDLSEPFLKRALLKGSIHPKGGTVVVSIKDSSGKEHVGTSKCNIKDSFVKKTGLKKALGRAYSSLIKG